MNFAYPYFFLILFLIPIYFGFLWWQKKKKKERAIFFSCLDDLIKAKNKKFNYWQIVEHFLFFLIIIFFAISLARPQFAHEKQEINKEGIDIIVALDVSGSMLAEDLKPNRMESAKLSIEKFISKLKNDRLGIVVFAGQAFTQSPLTFDFDVLKEYLKTISTDSINQNVNGLNGTAVGDAILASVNRFKDSSLERTKVLVLLTDGDANVGVDPFLAATKANDEGIKIYAIGIGKVGGAPLPVTDALGRKTYAKNRDGSLFMTTFNEDSLKKIAEIGKGKYFRADDNASFEKVMDEINSLEKRDLKIKMNTEYTENFMKYLVALFILFLIYLIFWLTKFYQH